MDLNQLRNHRLSFFCEQHPNRDIPVPPEGWSKHVSMQFLMCGTYYEAFHPGGKRFVGVGEDAIFTH